MLAGLAVLFILLDFNQGHYVWDRQVHLSFPPRLV